MFKLFTHHAHQPLVLDPWLMYAICKTVLIIIIYLYGVGSHLQYKVQFVWMNQEDDKEVAS